MSLRSIVHVTFPGKGMIHLLSLSCLSTVDIFMNTTHTHKEMAKGRKEERKKEMFSFVISFDPSFYHLSYFLYSL